jgi:20S proteasome alpha/beta subunit
MITYAGRLPEPKLQKFCCTLLQNRKMSYIAAYHCQTGIVMCADTQETVGEYKKYVEKISIIEDQTYPLAIGGAGFGSLIDAATQEIIDRAKESKPSTKSELRSLVRASLKVVYEKDVPALGVPAKHRSPELLVAAKPTQDDFCIFLIRGRRILEEPRKAIVGYATAYNAELLKRLHRELLSMQQAVMLAVYLVSQSKKMDDGVGGETRVALVVENGAWIDDLEYVANSEQRVQDFLKLTDELFFHCIDVSIPPKQILEKLTQFVENVSQLRDSYLRYSAAHSLNRLLHEPGYKGDPYPKLFAGARTIVKGDLSVEVTDEPIPEHIRKSLSEPMPGYSETISELSDSLQAVMAQNTKGLWQLRVTKRVPDSDLPPPTEG